MGGLVVCLYKHCRHRLSVSGDLQSKKGSGGVGVGASSWRAGLCTSV